MPVCPLAARFACNTFPETPNSVLSTVAKEQSLVANMKKATAIDEPYVKYRFYEEGEHQYEVKEYERSFNLA